MKLTTLKSTLGKQGNRLATLNPDSWRSTKQTSAQRGYGYKWQQAREGWLLKHPLCVMCEAEGTSTTNWLNTSTYMQLYQLVASTSTFTIATTSDKRQAFGGAGSTGFTGGTLTSALNEAPAVSLGSAATVNIGAAAANSISITGGTTITAFDTIAASAKRQCWSSRAPSRSRTTQLR